MSPRRRIPPALALAAVAALACGKSAQEKLADQLEAECNALAPQHQTFGQADAMFRAANVRIDNLDPQTGKCATNLAPLAGGNDTCGDPAAGICQSLWYWSTNDPGLCGPMGCSLVCEARMTQASITANSATAPVCASRFFREQPP